MADDNVIDIKSKAGKRKRPAPRPQDMETVHDEDKMALRFAELYKGKLLFDHSFGKWFLWDGNHWKQDQTTCAYDWARDLVRGYKDGVDLRTDRKTLGRCSTTLAVEKFARMDRDLVIEPGQWDKDDFLLGTPGGTVDLRTGVIRCAVSTDHITRLTEVSPSLNNDCPLWTTFLYEACGGDVDLLEFLQLYAGYMLTGNVREHSLLFIYGRGKNGKSVFINTLSNIMGSYAKAAAMDTFTSSNSDKHPTELAMLDGPRLVTSSETDEGRAWAEARIKQITGGDPIMARYMRQDFFEFMPKFKLVIVGNHKPALRNVDDAMARRINIVPFNHTPENPNPQLMDQLRSEYPSILRWMIEGCLRWQEFGLVKPKIVADATADYLSDQDTFRQWMDQCCTVHPRESATNNHLFDSWSSFAKLHGEAEKTTKWLSSNLEREGFRRLKSTPGFGSMRGWQGISVKPEYRRGSDD